jgi:hypothetical protein
MCRSTVFCIHALLQRVLDLKASTRFCLFEFLSKLNRWQTLIDHEATELDREEEAGGYSYKTMLDRDKRRWSSADVNGDGALDREEFAAFLHPEETPHMKDIVVLETMEDIDKDKDGKISLEEYVG